MKILFVVDGIDDDDEGFLDLCGLFLMSAQGSTKPVDDQRRESVQPLPWRSFVVMRISANIYS